MLGLIRAMRIGLIVAAGAIMLLGAPSTSYAETGSVRIKIAKAGFIVGVGGGSGIMRGCRAGAFSQKSMK